jgi:hypothetical protein
LKTLQHIIDRIPVLEREGMYVEYEELANQIVASGLLRVDTENKCNFARWVDAGKNISMMISKEELEGELIEKTKAKLSKIYKTPEEIQRVIDNCNTQLKKLLPVDKDLRLKLARLLVQSTHSIVMRWILLEQVEIFVSYSNSIGDLMDVMTWQHSGSNSGMQSTDGRDVAVFVSSGGDPFAPTDPEVRIYGDGWPAVARIQIIAGQELGHYSDIKRDSRGRQIGRFAADFACTRAAPHVREGRVKDLQICDEVRGVLLKNGMNRLFTHETALDFYRKNKITSLKVTYHKIMAGIYKQKLLRLAKNPEWLFLRKFYQEKYMSLMLEGMIDDMKGNLNPIADVYKRENKEAEIAISCVEALARVPQQANKWGHITTSAMMKNLYVVYYEEVIPDLIDIYEKITDKPYKPNLNRIPVSFVQKIKNFFKKKDLPYRELDK